ncbi:MAG: aminotransferase class IV, partial [Lewinella sp.]
NFMIVREGVLITPAENVLLGVTRLHLLKVAASLGIATQEGPVSVTDLLEADEAIICSSVKGAMPITKVLGGDQFSTRDYGEPGAVTRRLIAAWRNYV